MLCNCSTYQCLDVFFDPCSEGAQLSIVATESTTWNGMIEFNGMWSRFDFGVISGQRIIIPTAFLNGYYTHVLVLRNSVGALVGNVCYKMKSRALVGSGEYAVIPGGTNNFFDITVPEAGDSITDPRLAGHTVSHIVTDGQAYNEAYWEKPLADDTLTSTILSFYPGQIITIVLSS